MSPVDVDFGRDVSTYPDLGDTFAPLSGIAVIAQATARSLEDAQDGVDLRHWLNESLESADVFHLQQTIGAQCLRDERVQGVAVAVTQPLLHELRIAIGRTNAGIEYWALDASDQTRSRGPSHGRAPRCRAASSSSSPAPAAGSAAILAIVDAYVQPRVPLTISCVTASAKTVTVVVARTVHVRSGLRTQAQAAAEAALAEYVAAVPIGGEKVGTAGVVSREVLAACVARGSPANRVVGVVDLALTTPAADVALGATEVPILDWTEV